MRWVRERDESELHLSVVTIGELEKGIARLPDSAKRLALEQWVRRDLAERFRARLLSIDAGIASRWGAISGASEARGQSLPVVDALIAATALLHDLVVVTRNTEDLERCGARCLNPWLSN
jgi:predicted nucleic acid-binding protein